MARKPRRRKTFESEEIVVSEVQPSLLLRGDLHSGLRWMALILRMLLDLVERMLNTEANRGR